MNKFSNFIMGGISQNFSDNLRLTSKVSNNKIYFFEKKKNFNYLTKK